VDCVRRSCGHTRGNVVFVQPRPCAYFSVCKKLIKSANSRTVRPASRPLGINETSDVRSDSIFFASSSVLGASTRNCVSVPNSNRQALFTSLNGVGRLSGIFLIASGGAPTEKFKLLGVFSGACRVVQRSGSCNRGIPETPFQGALPNRNRFEPDIEN